MDAEQTVFEYDEPEGKVWVTVLAAIEDQEHRDGRRVTVTFPTLRISTFADGLNHGDENQRHVTLRGRKYSIDSVQVRRNYGEGREWSSDHRTYHSKGLLNEAGSALDWKSPVRDRLRDIEARVRDRFAEDHPQWTVTSQRLRLAWMIRHADDEARSLRHRADQEQANADKLRAELASL